MQGIKLVTFDATNTLLNFRMPPWHYYTVVARDYGFKGSEGEVKKRLLDSYSLMWKKYPNFGKNQVTWDNWWRQVVQKTFDGQLPQVSNINEIANRLIDEFKTTKCWSLADGSIKLLQILEKERIVLGVISNFDPRLYEILQNTGILKKFKFVITSYDSGFSKPDARIFKLALDQTGQIICPIEALHIGDDFVKDYQGAQAAGWHALLVTNNKEIESEKPPAPQHVFSSLDELCLVIEKAKLSL